jgi:integrase
MKKLNGKMYAVSCRQLGVEPSRKASAPLANAWWNSKLAELEANDPAKNDCARAIVEWTKRADWSREQNDVALLKSIEGTIARLRQLQASGEPLELSNQDHPLFYQDVSRLWEDRLSRRGADSTPHRETIGEAIAEFLSRKKSQSEGEQISIGRAANLQQHLKHVESFFGSTAPVNSLDEAAIEKFHSHLLAEIGQKKSKPSYAANRFNSFKQFVFWAWKLHKLSDIPRNLLKSSDLQIKVTTSKIQTFSVEEFQNLIAAPTTDRTRLYLLLMLNCGMTSKDVSDLAPAEIDWKNRTITRKRSKTKSHSNVPVVTYPLWNETFQLLKKLKSDDKNHVLMGAKGLPLVGDKLSADWVRGNKNAIRLAYNRVVKRLKIANPLPPTTIRKTGASMLADSEYGSLAPLYLGHAPRSIADKHYSQTPTKTFGDAIRWLGDQFGIK